MAPKAKITRKRVKAGKIRGQAWGVVYAESGRKVPGTIEHGEGIIARRLAENEARMMNQLN